MRRGRTFGPARRNGGRQDRHADPQRHVAAGRLPHDSAPRGRRQHQDPKIGNHTFRATGITAYLKNNGTLEAAQQIANHESPRTTKLYDRTDDQITLDEVDKDRNLVRRAILKEYNLIVDNGQRPSTSTPSFGSFVVLARRLDGDDDAGSDGHERSAVFCVFEFPFL